MNLWAVCLFLQVALVHESIWVRSVELGFDSNNRAKGSDFSLRFT